MFKEKAGFAVKLQPISVQVLLAKLEPSERGRFVLLYRSPAKITHILSICGIILGNRALCREEGLLLRLAQNNLSKGGKHMSQLRFLTLVGAFLLLSGVTFVAVRVTSLSNDAAVAAESGSKDAVPKKSDETKLQTAIFAAGCFWHVEDSFRHVKGVVEVTSGYTGGNYKNPSYEDVCSGKTHHAESVKVVYDPAKVSYGELLNTFWQIHDPTTLNAQGPDHGEQYRSAIFCLTEQQKAAAIASRDKLAASGKLKSPIVTQILAAGDFYPAEEYHQRYFEKHGMAGCAVPVRK